MPSKEVVTFWLDMGAPISLLSRVIARRALPDFRTLVKAASCRSIGSSQRFQARRTEAGLAGWCVNDSPGMDSTTREPVPIRAYGCPVGSTPDSIMASFDGMRGWYETESCAGRTPRGAVYRSGTRGTRP